MAIKDPTLAANYQSIHASKTYGVSGNKFKEHIQILIAEIRPANVLNFGCGQTDLQDHLELFGGTYHRYDTGFPELSTLPVDKADFLINTDVLEHIPEKDLDEVLAKMASITSKAFFNIATRPAKEILPNGDNAHCTILSASQWESILKTHFPDVQLVLDRPGHSCMFVTWPSCMAPILAALSQAQLDRKKVQKAKVPISAKVSAEVKRATRKLFKS